MAKFKLFWENNPETPLTAERLSSFINHYSKDSIIYSDDDMFLSNGDGRLKIRDSAKIGHISQNTLAAFDFDATLTSFNSKFAPIKERDVIYRDEFFDKKGAIIADEAITNILSNPGFEDGDLDWTFEQESGVDSTIEFTTEDYYPALEIDNLKSAKITTGDVYGLSKLIKTIDVTGVDDLASLSFYYKSTGNFYFLLKYGPEEDLKYWNSIEWSVQENRYELEPINEWTRIELSQIKTSGIDTITLEVYISATAKTFYFDSFVVESKPYCSSFYHRDTDSTILAYNNDIINYKRGLIDFVFQPKYRAKNTFFVLKSSNPSQDALRLEYDSLNNQFVVNFYDNFESAYLEESVSYNYNSLIDKWCRIIFNWDIYNKNFQLSIIELPEEGEELNVSSMQIYDFTLPDTFIPFEKNDLEYFYIGSNDGNDPARSMFEFFKINRKNKSQDKLLRDLNQYTYIDSPQYKLFENSHKSLVIDESYLDQEDSFTSNTRYYLWIGDNEDFDSCDLIVSKSANSPANYDWFNSTLVGGFHTDNSGDIDLSSLWDLTTYQTKNLHTDRILIGNTRTRNIDDTDITNKETPIEFRTEPYGNDATFNIDTYVTKHLYGRNRTDGNFLDIDNENGEMFLDNLHFNSHTINSIGSDLEIFAESPNTLNLHSKEITLLSEGTDIKLDDLRILDNQLYVKNDSNLVVNTTIDGDNDLYFITGIMDTTSHTTQFTNTGNFTIDANGDFISSVENFEVNSNGLIKLDSLIIDDNILYRDGNFQLKSNSSYVEIENVKFNNNKIFYGDEAKRYIQFYTDSTDDTLENIDIASDNLIKIDSPRFEVTASEIVFHADMSNYFRLEDLRVDQNMLFTESGTPLLIGGQGANLSNNVYVTSTNNIYLTTDTITMSSSITNIDGTLNLEDLRIVDSTLDSPAMQLNLGNDANKTFITGNDIDISSSSSSVKILSNLEITEKVGIGTSNPSGKLHLNNIGNTIFNIDSPDSYNSNIDMLSKTYNGETGLGSAFTKGWTLSVIGDQWPDDATKRNDLTIKYWDAVEWHDVLHLDSNSNIGIGTSSPSQKLEVSGNIKLQSTNPSIEFSNTSTTNNWKIEHIGDDSLSLTSSTYNNLTFNSVGQSVFGAMDPQGYLLRIAGNEKVDSYLTVGSISGGQSSFQGTSLQNNNGYIETPWLYVSGGIEADERGAQGTGIFFNEGIFAGSSTDTITFVTNGVKRAQIHSNGGLSIGSSGRFVGGAPTTNTDIPNEGDITYNGDFWAYRVYNAVWMDLAECWMKDESYEFDYGMVVVQTENGIRPAQKRAEKGTVGIISNTYGYVLGAIDFNEKDFANSRSLPIAISGRVEASYKGKLEIGDEVVSAEGAILIRANFIEKIIKRDRIVGRVDEILQNKRCKIKVY